MYSKKPKNLSLLKQSLIFSLILTIFAGTAYAGKSFVQDKRISMVEAKKMASSKAFDIPIEVNDLVLEQLNHYAGTAEGRTYFKEAMVRMKFYQPMIEKKLLVNRLPLDLMAIPIVESAYKNLPQDPEHRSWGAGLWMFIESTARVYGLRVDAEVDERLNPGLLTDAAATYLQSNYTLFSDWKLAILAYNIGENNLIKHMKRLDTRDAWVVIRNGGENDKKYLARVMASMIILKNPEILD